jgi:hypothetical protein
MYTHISIRLPYLYLSHFISTSIQLRPLDVIQGTFPWIFASLDAPVPRIGATFLDTRQLDKGASTVGASTAETSG